MQVVGCTRYPKAGQPDLLDVESWDADDTGSLADRCLLRIRWQAANLVRGGLARRGGSVDGAVLSKDEEDRTRREPERLEARAGFFSGTEGSEGFHAEPSFSE